MKLQYKYCDPNIDRDHDRKPERITCVTLCCCRKRFERKLSSARQLNLYLAFLWEICVYLQQILQVASTHTAQTACWGKVFRQSFKYYSKPNRFNIRRLSEMQRKKMVEIHISQPQAHKKWLISDTSNLSNPATDKIINYYYSKSAAENFLPLNVDCNILAAVEMEIIMQLCVEGIYVDARGISSKHRPLH